VETSLRKVGVARTHLRGGWREVLSLNYQREDFQLGLTDETTGLLIPGASYAYVRTDNRVVTRHGYALQFDLRGAADRMLSDINFTQAGIKAKWIQAVSKQARVTVRTQGGTTWTDDFDKLPATLRYFAGGDQSVRGYDFEELGPRDASGEVIGGKHLVFGSLEYEQRIHGNWGVAVFFDTGNAFNSVSEGLESGAGIGLRWRSPIGMVRVDLASAISEDNSLRLHFTLGPDL
jgi:translocation and assembly module TamA